MKKEKEHFIRYDKFFGTNMIRMSSYGHHALDQLMRQGPGLQHVLFDSPQSAPDGRQSETPCEDGFEGINAATIMHM